MTEEKKEQTTEMDWEDRLQRGVDKLHVLKTLCSGQATGEIEYRENLFEGMSHIIDEIIEDVATAFP